MNYLCCFVHNIGIIDEMVPEKLLNWIIMVNPILTGTRHSADDFDKTKAWRVCGSRFG
jgi:hypothetical protein